MTLPNTDLRTLIELAEKAFIEKHCTIDMPVGEDEAVFYQAANPTTVKALCEELLARREVQKHLKEWVEKINADLQEIDKHDFSDYGSSGMPAKNEEGK